MSLVNGTRDARTSAVPVLFNPTLQQQRDIVIVTHTGRQMFEIILLIIKVPWISINYGLTSRTL